MYVSLLTPSQFPSGGPRKAGTLKRRLFFTLLLSPHLLSLRLPSVFLFHILMTNIKFCIHQRRRQGRRPVISGGCRQSHKSRHRAALDASALYTGVLSVCWQNRTGAIAIFCVVNIQVAGVQARTKSERSLQQRMVNRFGRKELPIQDKRGNSEVHNIQKCECSQT